MRVRFRDNIGTRDAGRHFLGFRDCTKGAELEVSDETGAALVRENLADAVDIPSSSPAETVLHAVPPADELQSSPLAELEQKYVEEKARKRKSK